MNVIFLDLDGVLDTCHYQTHEQVEEKIKILAEIVHEYDCKIVLEAAAKDSLDEETLEIKYPSEWISFLIQTFKKYGIELIGRTPNVIIHTSSYSYIPMWKESEIKLYLFRHPEIEHFCIIDDDDLKNMAKSDLESLRDYLVTTLDYNREYPEFEGLLEEHKEQVGKILKLDNKYQKYAKKHMNKIVID